MAKAFTTPSVLGITIAGLLLLSCAPGPNDLLNTASSHGRIGGFWPGLWHGVIAPVTFIISLFRKDVNVYELHNNGGWYNFGFLLGICISLGGSAGAARGRSRREPRGRDQAQCGSVKEFLAQRRLALIGVSRQQVDFSRGLFRELLRRGYDMVPVNPALTEVEGQRCYARLQDIKPPVDGAILMTPPSQTEAAVRDCLEAGIRRVWMHRGVGPGAVSQPALDLCAASHLLVVAGECPYMYLPNAGAIHRLHRVLRRRPADHPIADSTA